MPAAKAAWGRSGPFSFTGGAQGPSSTWPPWRPGTGKASGGSPATGPPGPGRASRRWSALRRWRGWSFPLELLSALDLLPRATVLLEDLGNLAANELYSPGGGGEAALLSGLERLFDRAENLVIIGNAVFGEGPGLDGEMGAYLQALSAAQSLCAARCGIAAEVVCGIPLYHKFPGKEAPRL